MRQFLSMLALAAGLMQSGAALAQDFSPVMFVNDSAVTQYELDQRIRFMQLLRAPGADRDSALRDLIDDRLRVQQAKVMGIDVTDESLAQGMSEFAGRANMDTFSFVQEISRAGVSEETFRDFVYAGLVWRGVVQQRVIPTVNVSDAEVEQQMQRVIETPQTTRVLFSELVIPAPPGREAEAMGIAQRLSETVRTEAQFAAAARQYSATPSRTNGGRLPWAEVANLPEGLGNILLRLQPGQITPPLTVQGAVILFYLRDTQGRLRPGATDQVVDVLRVTVADTAQAADFSARARTCADLHVLARNLPDSQVQQIKGNLNTIPQAVSMLLPTLDENESTWVDRGGAADVVMLCDRTPALIDGLQGGPVATGTTDGTTDTPPDTNALPSMRDMRNQTFNAKINRAADAFLAELRANAIIRRP